MRLKIAYEGIGNAPWWSEAPAPCSAMPRQPGYAGRPVTSAPALAESPNNARKPQVPNYVSRATLEEARFFSLEPAG